MERQNAISRGIILFVNVTVFLNKSRDLCEKTDGPSDTIKSVVHRLLAIPTFECIATLRTFPFSASTTISTKFKLLRCKNPKRHAVTLVVVECIFYVLIHRHVDTSHSQSHNTND